MKILLLDIESSPHLAYVWKLWGQDYINYGNLLETGQVLCWAAKWFGEKEVMFDSVYHSGQEAMLEGIYNLLDEADVVIHYNGSRFDIPYLNKEFLELGITPPSPYKQIDLFKTAKRQFKFVSNKLDDVADQLGLKGKKSHEGFQLWVKCMAEDPAAWKVMEAYNKQDVRVLEQVYKRFLPWIKGHPNAGLFKEKVDRPTCSTCGSTKVHMRGHTRTNTGVYHRYQCQLCGTWSRARTMEKVSKEGLLIRDNG